MADAAAPRIALGVCGDLIADNTLTVEGATAGMLALGVNGKSTTRSPLHVTGPFISFGDIEARNTQDVTGTLQTAGALTVSAPMNVGADAFVGGALQASNSVNIVGTLHAPTGTSMTNVNAGSVALGAVTVAKPLSCDVSPRVADLIEMARASRDGLADNVLPGDALNGVKSPTDLTLGCGRYVFSGVEIQNTLNLHVKGATVLVIDGNFRVGSPTVITLEAGATLDLVIGGNLDIDNSLTIGRDADPTATWISVGGDIRVASPFVLHGVLSAPQATVRGDNTFDLEGSALVGSLTVASPMVVHPTPLLTSTGCLAP